MRRFATWKKWWRSGNFSFLALVMTSPQAGAKVLNFSKARFGFELKGGYHLLSSFDAIRGTIDSTITRSPSKKSQNLDFGINFLYMLHRFRVRTGVYFAMPLNYNATGANCYTASVTAFSLGYLTGFDVAAYQTERMRVSLGGIIGITHLNRATIKYSFFGGCADTARTEKLQAMWTLFYGGSVGIETAVFSRMSIGLDVGYLYNNINKWKAASDLPSGGLRSSTISAGQSAVLPGQSKNEKLGGFFAQLVFRSYF